MQQFTTEWAKEYLRECGGVIAIAQDEGLCVYSYVLKVFGDGWHAEIFDDLGYMLEHPDGWENSKVTREEL